MTCTCKTAHPSLVETFVREGFFPPSMKNWRAYRIEYGFECSCPEGIIFLPRYVDPGTVERAMYAEDN